MAQTDTTTQRRRIAELIGGVYHRTEMLWAGGTYHSTSTLDGLFAIFDAFLAVKGWGWGRPFNEDGEPYWAVVNVDRLPAGVSIADTGNRVADMTAWILAALEIEYGAKA